MKFVIVGGVAAGAGAAARLRRLDEQAQIILLEQGKFISYANCGLPYYLGGVIPDRSDLLIMSPEKFSAWFRVDVRIQNQVSSIDRAKKLLTVESPGGEYTESYDKLLLATGATPAATMPPEEIPPRVHHLWTLADMDRLANRLNAGVKRAVIIGAGFIGLETAENFRARGLDVTIVQRSNHVLPTFDPDLASPLTDELAANGITLKFGRTVKAYEEEDNVLRIILDNDETLETDFALRAIGVKPNSALAAESGLACGKRGHITVDEHLRTSDPDIYAAGDVAETVEPIFGGRIAIPLAGPANKQGRIAADNMAGGGSVYRGVFGASVLKVGRLTAGSVGFTERRLNAMNKPYRKIYLHPASNASYYPGSARMDLKLIFGGDGTIYGAQAVGMKGVDKRIDTIAVAMRCGLKAPQLGELELAYAPPYSSAKDPVNFAGFIAQNVLSGLSDAVYPDAVPADAVALDVREKEENALGAIPGARNIPLGQLRDRLDELDKSKLIVTYCQAGLRGYLAERILKQHGFRAANLSGGWLTWQMFHPVPKQAAKAAAPAASVASAPSSVANAETLDVRSLPCPGPVMKLKTKMDGAAPGTVFHVLAALTFEGDLTRWAAAGGYILTNLTRKAEWLEADVQKTASSISQEITPSCSLPEKDGNSIVIVLFSNDFDKAVAALILANGFAAAGRRVSIFFTFWGLSVLRKDAAPPVKKDFMSSMFGWMLPKGAKKLALSKLNMLGMGTAMMKRVMAKQSVLTLPELIESARGCGVKFIACEMAMNVMGLAREELIEVDEVAGVASFAALAGKSSITLFI